MYEVYKIFKWYFEDSGKYFRFYILNAEKYGDAEVY